MYIFNYVLKLKKESQMVNITSPPWRHHPCSDVTTPVMTSPPLQWRHHPCSDEDMRSVTSEMSQMTFAGFEDGYMSENEFDNYNEQNQEEK